MRFERWYWFFVFCMLSVCLHIGLAIKSRTLWLHQIAPSAPGPRGLEVTLETPAPPKPEPKPAPEPKPRSASDFGKQVKAPPHLVARALRMTHNQPIVPSNEQPQAKPLPAAEHTVQEVIARAPLPNPNPAPETKQSVTPPGGEDKLKDEKPLPLGAPDAPKAVKTTDAPQLARMAKPEASIKVSANEGGGSPAPDRTLTGKNGAAGPEAPPEDVVYSGGGAGGINLPKAPAKIGGGGGSAILAVNNPLAKEAVPDDKPGLGPGAGGGAGTGSGGGVGFRGGKGIGTRREGRDTLATLNSKPGNGIGAGTGSNTGTKAPGGGKGTGAEMPGTGGEGTGYGRGRGIEIGTGSGVGRGSGGEGIGTARLTGNTHSGFGDLSGLLRGDPNGGGGIGGGTGGNGRGPGSGGGFGSVQQTPFALKGDIYLLEPNTQKLPDFATMKPIGSVYTTELNIPTRHWDKGFPGVTDRFEWFAIDYNGVFALKKPTNFKFRLTSDDGSKLFIDDQIVIDHDGLHSTSTKEGTISLPRGKHKIRVQYFQGPKDEIALVLEVTEQ